MTSPIEVAEAPPDARRGHTDTDVVTFCQERVVSTGDLMESVISYWAIHIREWIATLDKLKSSPDTSARARRALRGEERITRFRTTCAPGRADDNFRHRSVSRGSRDEGRSDQAQRDVPADPRSWRGRGGNAADLQACARPERGTHAVGTPKSRITDIPSLCQRTLTVFISPV